MQELNTTHSDQARANEPEEQAPESLSTLLATAVTLRIKQLRATGGPTIAQAQRVTAHLDRAQAPLFRPPQLDDEDGITRQTVEALAVLAFIPGGVDALGLHCQANGEPPVRVARLSC